MLEYIYKGAEMGHEAISQLIKESDDKQFSQALESQRDEYRQVMDEAQRLMHERGGQTKGIGTVQKVSSQAVTTMKTMTDNSPSKMAEMMIQGSTMGVTKMTRYIGELGGVDSEVSRLSHKLIDTEENNIEQMKKFL